MTGRKDVRRRLQNAALQLYAERGFDSTTTAEVATLAGVTERTYFRHFPDKREVLFDGQAALDTALVDAVASAPDLAPLAVLRHAFLALVPLFESDRALQQRRHSVISRTPELRERGATKLAHLTEVMASVLERRDVPPALAFLAAACGIGVLNRVRREWLAGSPHSYPALLTSAFADLDLLLEAQDNA
jgi:AcrR family transcriptional regulator